MWFLCITTLSSVIIFYAIQWWRKPKWTRFCKVPIVDINRISDGAYVRKLFFDESGCFIVRQCFSARTCDDFNTWCEKHMDSDRGKNARHPIQKDKRLIIAMTITHVFLTAPNKELPNTLLVECS